MNKIMKRFLPVFMTALIIISGAANVTPALASDSSAADSNSQITRGVDYNQSAIHKCGTNQITYKFTLPSYVSYANISEFHYMPDGVHMTIGITLGLAADPETDEYITTGDIEWEYRPKDGTRDIVLNLNLTKTTIFQIRGFDDDENCFISDYFEVTLDSPPAHNYVETAHTELSCFTDETITYECSLCGDVLTEITRKAPGHHTQGEILEETEGTCIANGQKTYICAECGETVTEETPPSNVHKLVNIPEKQPTCTENGHCAYKECSVCGEKIGYISKVRLGHSYIETNNVLTPATPEADGSVEYICAHCHDTYVGKIPKISNISLEKESALFDGNSHFPIVRVCDETGIGLPPSHYRVSYDSDFRDIGEYKVTVQLFSTKYEGSKTLHYTVYEKLKTADVSDVVYKAKRGKPVVKVYDSHGNLISRRNYKVVLPKKYSEIGKYKLKIVPVNKFYRKTLTATFKVVPRKTEIKKLSSGRGSVKVSWKNRKAQTSGYEIQYSTYCDFDNYSSIVIRNSRVNSYTISPLLKDTDYYIRVRTFKTVNGKRFYSEWSKEKSVTVKK